MKTVSNEFLNEQAKHELVYYRHITLYKRSWNGSAYVLDAGTNIDEYVIQAGKTVAALDEIANEWKTGNFDIAVKNINREWNRNNPDGLWFGYLPEFSEVSIIFGYVDSGAVERGVAVFRGVITFEGVKEDLEKKTATLHIRGYQDILDKYSSEDLPENQAVGSALIGTVNGVNTTFTTANNGVGIIKAVYHDGTEYKVNVYSTSGTNVKASPATIEFDTAPTSGASLTADYVYWYQDKSFKYLIEKLLDHADITDRDIQEVTFPGNVPIDFTQDTDAQFTAGTMDGNLYVENNALNMPIAKQLQYPGGNHYTISFYEGIMAQSFKVKKTGIMTRIGIKQRMSFVEGSSSCKIIITIRNDNAGNPGTILATEEVFINGSNQTYWDFFEKDGFNLNLSINTTYWLCFEIIKTGGAGYPSVSFNETYQNRYDDGNASYYDTSWHPMTNTDLQFYVKYTADDYKWMSITEDCGASLQAWGTLDYSSAAVGSYLFYTRTQDADTGWPATFNPAEWDAIGLGGIINSTLKRYLRVAVRVQYNPQINDLNQNPFVSYINVRYYTSKFDIKLANFTGQSHNDSIKEMAVICDYQFGFTAEGKFFWRAKELSPAVDLYLYGITKLLNYKVYWNLLRNKVTATFGKYSKTISSITEGEAHPHSIDKFGVRKFSISGGNLLNDENVDIAEGAVQRYYDGYNAEKRGCRFNCKSFAQLDLGDIVKLVKYAGLGSINLVDDHIVDDYTIGDDYDPPYELTMKIIKLTADTDFLKSGGMEIEAMEV